MGRSTCDWHWERQYAYGILRFLSLVVCVGGS